MTSVANVPAYMLPGVPAVQQPRSGLDSGDPTLATEILPGPPSLASVQQAATKRDPRKPMPVVSYLPQYDPGTTYGGVTTGPTVGSLEQNPAVEGPRRKRARIDKGLSSHRGQRVSARGLNALNPSEDSIVVNEAVASAMLDIPDSDPFLAAADSDGPMLSRSNSISHLEDPVAMSGTSRAPKKDKGKGKEKVIVRVKEEPSTVTLQMTESNPTSFVRNEDHCSACRSLGSLVYCDGCPRAYHFWCLDPPMEHSDLPEADDRWYCPSCKLRQNPPPKPPPSFMSPLIAHLQNTLPVEFQLPDELRTFFKSVGTSARGAYVDTSTVKPPRLNRHGQLEERDPYRTKDRNGDPVLCYRCATSAIPDGMAVTAPAAKRLRSAQGYVSSNESWKSIVSCDYCPNHWHLDCLNPPLMNMPPFDKKWMCPLHAENTLRPKHRIPKQNAPPIDINKPGQVNNGNIEIVEPEISPVDETRVPVDEVFINGRRYRVPERIIKLDFWNKLNKIRNPPDQHFGGTSGMSSPLTSLSSLEEVEDPSQVLPPPQLPSQSFQADDLRTALMLLDMKSSEVSSSTATPEPVKLVTNGMRRLLVDGGVQTDMDPPVQLVLSKPPALPRLSVSLKPPVQSNSSTQVQSSAQSNASNQPGPSTLVEQNDQHSRVSSAGRHFRGRNASKRVQQTERRPIKREPSPIDLDSLLFKRPLDVQTEPKATEPERRQPSRASKRDVKYVIQLDLEDSADEGLPVSSYSAPTLMDVDPAPAQSLAPVKAKRPPGRPRKSAPTSAPSKSSRVRAKDAILAAALPSSQFQAPSQLTNSETSARPPASFTAKRQPVAAHTAPIAIPVSAPALPATAGATPCAVAPVQSAHSQTSTSTSGSFTSLKIRLPARLSTHKPGAAAAAAPAPVLSPSATIMSQSRLRRSLRRERRQNSAPTSSSTTTSHLDDLDKPTSPTL